MRERNSGSRRPVIFFFFNDTATTEIYTLSLHDALPISPAWPLGPPPETLIRASYLSAVPVTVRGWAATNTTRDRKSTRLNSSHANISYAVFCLKKKKPAETHRQRLQKTNLPPRPAKTFP